jgi:methylmalonyl-CoA mutase C-terminal domain/subunit
MEVIYLGKYQTAESVATVAAHEDADVIAVSFLSGEYRQMVPALRMALAHLGADAVRIVVGGLIDPADVDDLARDGADAVFGPGATIDDVVSYLNQPVREVA